MDTVQMYLGYGFDDGLVIRHPAEGSARFVQERVGCPVINGGDGGHEHPTQALLDYATIAHLKGGVGAFKGLKIGRVGDLKHGRTVHSGLLLDGLLGVQAYLASPDILRMPRWALEKYASLSRLSPVQKDSIDDIIADIDVLYATRVQQERFADANDYARVKDQFVIGLDLLEKGGEGLFVLHPLPRNKRAIEIPYALDASPKAKWILQAQMGLYLRMALCAATMGVWPGQGRDFHFTERVAAQGSLIETLEIERRPDEDQRKKHYLLRRIDNGTVIDHLRPENAFSALVRLGIYHPNGSKTPEYEGHIVGFLDDLTSSKGPLQRKSVVKIQNRRLDETQLTRLALEFPEAVVSYIEDSKVVKKFRVNVPSRVDDLLTCQNTRCISHPSQLEGCTSKFYSMGADEFQCHYCDNIYSRDVLL